MNRTGDKWRVAATNTAVPVSTLFLLSQRVSETQCLNATRSQHGLQSGELHGGAVACGLGPRRGQLDDRKHTSQAHPPPVVTPFSQQVPAELAGENPSVPQFKSTLQLHAGSCSAPLVVCIEDFFARRAGHQQIPRTK